jgi:hypothetical protein
MGLDAQVIGIGSFSQKLVAALEYPKDFYNGVSEGAIVVTYVFEALTSEQSHKLAESFGVKAMDLGNHVLKSDSADLASLEKEFGREAVQKFQMLREAKFKFYYLPNA